MPQGQTDPLQVQDSHQGPWRCCWRQLLSYAMKTQLNAPKARLPGHILPFTVSLWHKSTNNRFFLCMHWPLVNQSEHSISRDLDQWEWPTLGRSSQAICYHRDNTITRHCTVLRQYSHTVAICVMWYVFIWMCALRYYLYLYLYHKYLMCFMTVCVAFVLSLWRSVLPLFYLYDGVCYLCFIFIFTMALSYYHMWLCLYLNDGVPYDIIFTWTDWDPLIPGSSEVSGSGFILYFVLSRYDNHESILRSDYLTYTTLRAA